MSKLPIYELFLSVGNLKTKLQWSSKRFFNTTLFQLNRAPDAEADEGGQDGAGHGGEATGHYGV